MPSLIAAKKLLFEIKLPFHNFYQLCLQAIHKQYPDLCRQENFVHVCVYECQDVSRIFSTAFLPNTSLEFDCTC